MYSGFGSRVWGSGLGYSGFGSRFGVCVRVVCLGKFSDLQ